MENTPLQTSFAFDTVNLSKVFHGCSYNASRPALLCPASHLLSPIGIVLTGVRAVGNLNAFVSSSVGNLQLESKGLQ